LLRCILIKTGKLASTLITIIDVELSFIIENSVLVH